ncbi:gliding motility associated protein GldN [Lewinella marina]|uniref:Gliding motility protein GldN n=1 Tax=Neolewinella marina TaxID=438751 RepID=A0A2G0CDD4_9BACT|nr:gliding motility protein GldN [Neolewinella marina]NJB86051.1 gliding motility associated protein GldN [Neolewinella marina]PHK97984.1 gliding motility protein GldN [Neolewinella marina]
MKAAYKMVLLLLVAVSAVASAQTPNNPEQQPSTFTLPGAGDDNVLMQGEEFKPPLNDIVDGTSIRERRVLPYENLREADIMWKRRIWRVIDVQEKINLPFINPQRPLITILLEAAQNGDLRVFDPIGGDNFSMLMDQQTLQQMAGGIDTVLVTDPNTYEQVEVYEERLFDPTSVMRYRIQEMWFFDKESSTMKVRILGIAPMIQETTENSRTIERPMFWVYYPEARQLLANESAFAYGNDAANRSWEDVFEYRFFNSYITKASNVLDERIDRPERSGREQLIESERIKQEIFNYEQDLWSY